MDTILKNPLVASYLNKGLVTLATFLVAKGVLRSDDVAGFVSQGVVAAGILLYLASMVWTWIRNRRTGVIKSASAVLEEGETVVINSPTEAAKLPDNVVAGPRG